MMTKYVSVSYTCLLCVLLSSSMLMAQTRTTPVEVSNIPTVDISTANNLVQTQVKSLKVSPLTTSLSIAPNSSAALPDISCIGYKEARIVLYSNIAYTVAQEITVKFYYDSVPLGMMPWWSLTNNLNQYGLSTICTSFSAILPVMGNTLKVSISNTSTSTISINPVSCWVLLVN